ncbi:8-amino-7-oxononanoate synthase [Gordonia araii NBRC 100433]|uniref:8-amino-7-oxononanoate synthase n=1 Tax=Gordonia araii NBRC 100433 TaxID=1073574 RepID=G7H2Q9_9ACTN|nr:8-amino-7-oxononanoate synthase [Gordonia araii]NNG98540.1 8-amino-7-oxononanoate synthase [Gordonia araii NBRC 100433]GAB10134.1 8-amino-7-oxononanoate synthase [Gordonia araii NBRC 100433]
MSDALDWLDDAARARAEAGLHRDPLVRRGGAEFLNLASNDYLGLSGDARVIDGARAALDEFGAGSTASRLVAGTTSAHVAFEDELADFAGFAAALSFSSGYLANVGAITALVGRGDLIVSDAGAHASLIDGCRLSRADVVVVDRGDVAAVDAALAAGGWRRALVVTDSVYSIDGHIAPVADLYAVARARGAVLLVDEAHALGVRGPGGRGVIAESGLSGVPDLVMTTVMSKSLGAQGGAVLGPRALRAHLIDTARPFIFDTGLNPAAVGAAHAALRILRAVPSLPHRVRGNAEAIARACGADIPEAAVVSIIIGDPHQAVALAARCREDGVLVGCFRPPSVPAGTSRLRITARADLDAAAIERVAAVVNHHREAVCA